MFNYAHFHDLGEHLAAHRALANQAITAGAGNDGVVVNGVAVDRLNLAVPGKMEQLYRSGALVIFGTCALGGGETLTISANIQEDSAVGFDSGGVTTLVTFDDQIVLEAAEGEFAFVLPFDCEGARQFMRARIEADLSAANTDTVDLGAVFIFGGGRKTPADGASNL